MKIDYELNDEQRKILEYVKSNKGAVIIKGTAGSGKSFTASKIAQIYLKDTNLLSETKVGVITYTNALKDNLTSLINEPSITPLTAHIALKNFLELNNYPNKILYIDKKERISLLENIIKEIKLDKYDAVFLLDEFDWLYGSRILSIEDYQNRIRTGRGQGTRVDKEYVWKIFDIYRKKMREIERYDFDNIGNICMDYIEGAKEYKYLYSHLIVDELQDLPNSILMALVKICEYQNNISLIGDLAQSIYGRGIKWKEIGLENKKIFELEYNIRNTQQIAVAADALLQNEYKLDLYDKQDYTNMIPTNRQGSKPVVAICSNSEEQEWYVVNEILKINMQESIAILTRSKKTETFNKIQNKIKNHKLEWLSMHSSKGLEFDNVFIIDVNDNIIPRSSNISGSFDDYISTERRLLYVAMTRAKSKLYITTSDLPSRYLSEIDPTTIVPVAINSQAYEKIYNDRLNALSEIKNTFRQVFEEKNKKIGELEQKIEALELSNNSKQEQLFTLRKDLEKINSENINLEEKIQYVNEKIQILNPKYNAYSFRDTAKILILGGDGGLREVDIPPLLKDFGLPKDCFQWIHYEEIREFDITTLQDTIDFSDIIVGCVPHSAKEIKGYSSLVTFLEANINNYPKIQILREADGVLSKLSKTKLKEKIKNSAKYARVKGL